LRRSSQPERADIRLASMRAVLAAISAVFLFAGAGAASAEPGCGTPASGGESPLASDALFILKAAVGSEACADCLCDTNGSGSVTAGDALLGLKAAVGQQVALDCPPCSTTTTTLPGGCTAAAPEIPPLRIVAVHDTPGGFATFAAQPPGSPDWYLVEQSGLIRIVRGGQFLPTPFLDIEDAIGSDLDERGLLGLAFHPDYASNGRFFTMATPGSGADGSYAPVNADAVVEWSRSANADLAVATKVRDIVVLPTSNSNHNGGTVLFGPDEMLYVATGDGGGSCESAKPGSVQDTGTLFGKVLRLDVEAEPPFAAAGNPFEDDPRVLHYGLRNPFRFGFDRETGDFYLGDVGQSSFEEISFAAAGEAGRNFGWPAFEAATPDTCGDKPLGGPSPHTPPILSIDRRSGSDDPFADYRSVIGGRVYRGAAMPELDGVYFFADFQGDELGALRVCNGEVYGPVAIPLSSIPADEGTLENIGSIVEGNDGELYLTYGFATRIGKLAKQ
jgi:glucose/arabinose dehydrogenase